MAGYRGLCSYCYTVDAQLISGLVNGSSLVRHWIGFGISEGWSLIVIGFL